MKAIDRVKAARRQDRPCTMDFINSIFDGFIELHGDRAFGDDKAVVGGIAYLNDKPVTVIGIQKGKTVDENIARNFGMPHPEGYRKALRLMRQAEKFGRPVVTLINTPGAYCGIEAEERGEAEAIARNILEMLRIDTPIVAVVVGEAGSGGALALAAADEVWMLSNAIYYITSPESFSSILWKTPAKSEQAAEIMKLTSQDLLELNVIERIIQEPDGASDFRPCFEAVRAMLAEKIAELDARHEAGELLQTRGERFRKF
ncbi:MAG: acetyl-CoA carboxylase carboxyltransferase subunit alpha [Defluviitaleaceae bacterium]|nr:acetyl-CoA carboxylase carboxyltransferase subunit alpha [Defluviitaleaceae bacterium]